MAMRRVAFAPRLKVRKGFLARIYTHPAHDGDVGLAGADRRELETLIKAAARDPRVPVDLASRMVPKQGDIEEFAYGLASGMVLGNFMALFESRNKRLPDRDETADILATAASKMPLLRKSIMKHLELR